MDYKITGVSTTQMTVEYSDGSWANIPLDSSWTKKEEYLSAIKNWSSIGKKEIPIKDQLLKIGDTGVVGEGVPEPAKPEPIKLSWDNMRKMLYPIEEAQLEAIWDNEVGVTTKLEAIKTHIAMVKEYIPKESTKEAKYSMEEYEAIEKKVEEDSRNYINAFK
jgi:hypothetical protein|tara:strand:+ start:347 stop:832 length:486 start_codon:yes stop_codon:yes gene_type:complete